MTRFRDLVYSSIIFIIIFIAIIIFSVCAYGLYVVNSEFSSATGYALIHLEMIAYKAEMDLLLAAWGSTGIANALIMLGIDSIAHIAYFVFGACTVGIAAYLSFVQQKDEEKDWRKKEEKRRRKGKKKRTKLSHYWRNFGILSITFLIFPCIVLLLDVVQNFNNMVILTSPATYTGINTLVGTVIGVAKLPLAVFIGIYIVWAVVSSLAAFGW